MVPQLTDGCAEGGCLQRRGTSNLRDVTSAMVSMRRPRRKPGRIFTKFPYLGFINEMTNNTHSNYNSLQATLTKRLSHGLSFIAGYTFAHGLDNGSLNRFGMLPQDGPADQYANSDFDVRHRFTLSATYDIPGIKGYGQVLEGWQINAIVNIQSSQPWRVNDGGNNFNGTNDNADLWDFTGNPPPSRPALIRIPYCLAGACNTTSTYQPQRNRPHSVKFGSFVERLPWRRQRLRPRWRRYWLPAAMRPPAAMRS